MIGTIDVEVQAANPNMPLYPMRAFAGSPSSIRVRNVPKRIGDWCIRNVYLNAIYPDGTIKSASCVLTGGIWVGTIEGTSTTGTSMNGYTIFADGTDENGNTVTGYVLGKGDIYILDSNGQLNPDATRCVVRMLSAESATPMEGDFWPVNGTWYIYQDGQAKQVGVSQDDVDAMISAKADLSALEEVSSQIPLSVSQLENDSGYITSAQVEPMTTLGGTYDGYARNAYTATILKTFNDNNPNDNSYAAISSSYDTAASKWNFDIICYCFVFAPWNLSKLFSETFSPSIQLEWRYQTIWRNRGGRWSKTYTGWMWLAAGQYAITASEDGTPVGKFYVLYYSDATHQNCISADTDIHTITVETSQSGYTQNVTSIDGETDQITCIRSIGKTVDYTRDVAFKDELSAKADVSALNNYLPLSGGTITGDLTFGVGKIYIEGGGLAVEDWQGNYWTLYDSNGDPSQVVRMSDLSAKQDVLTTPQMSAINSVVDERATVVKYDDNSVVTYNIEGTLSRDDIEVTGKNIVEVKVGTAVTGIALHGFQYCYYLTTFTMPDTVTTIGGLAFSGCSRLVDIKMSNNITSIPNYTFEQCPGLVNIKLPEKLVEIESNVFLNCSGLTEITIPKNVTSIG